MMSEPGTIAGQPLTEDQAAFLRAEQARQAATASAGVTEAQAGTAAQMTDRGPLLPAEQTIDDLMAQLRAQSEKLEQMDRALGSVRQQMDEAQAAAGGPLTVRYAQGAADKLTALADAHPNNPLGLHHFDAPKEAAASLAGAARAVAKGTGPVEDLEKAAAVIRRFFARTHFRTGGGHVDASALLDDVETAVEEAAKLAAVV